MTDKLVLLNSVRLFSKIPRAQLGTLAEFLATEAHEDGGVVFEEGTPGDSLYFITTGTIVIAKKLRGPQADAAPYKELAVLGPGDCFGEMALIEADAPRSADAIARGKVVLCRLARSELNRWLSANPLLAMGFFTSLVELLSGRLRRSSNELTLLFDLSQLLLHRFSSAKDLLDKFMSRRMRYLEGDWSSGAYVYNEFNDEMDLVDVEGDYASVKDSIAIPARVDSSAWLDDQTFLVVFPGERKTLGYIVFHRAEPLTDDEKSETGRTLTTTARLVTAALVNLSFHIEEDLRSRLKSSAQMGHL